MGKVILVGATKGGVGKSISSYNLAYSLVSLGIELWGLNVRTDAEAKKNFVQQTVK